MQKNMQINMHCVKKQTYTIHSLLKKHEKSCMVQTNVKSCKKCTDQTRRTTNNMQQNIKHNKYCLCFFKYNYFLYHILKK